MNNDDVNGAPLDADQVPTTVTDTTAPPESQVVTPESEVEVSPENEAEVVFPERVEDYCSTFPEGLELAEGDEAVLAAFRESAFKAGVPEAAFGALVRDMLGFANAQEQSFALAQEERSRADLGKLREVYGSKFDAVSELVNNTVTNLAAKAGVSAALFNHPAVMNNPDTFKFFELVGNMMKESSFAPQVSSPEVVTANQELHEIYYGDGKMNKAFFDSQDPLHKSANERVNYLLSIGGKIS